MAESIIDDKSYDNAKHKFAGFCATRLQPKFEKAMKIVEHTTKEMKKEDNWAEEFMEAAFRWEMQFAHFDVYYRCACAFVLNLKRQALLQQPNDKLFKILTLAIEEAQTAILSVTKEKALPFGA